MSNRLVQAVALLLLLPLLAGLLAACGPAEIQEVTDDLGRTLAVEKAPERIVSLAPSNTEILFALGLGDRVVGVTNFCDYPEEAQEVAKVGSPFPGFDLETIVSLEPDLLLAFGFGHTPPEYVTTLEGLGLKVLILAPEDMEGVMRDIELVGQATGAEKQAQALVSDMRERVEAVVARTRETPRPRVFWEFDATDPLNPWTAGPGSFNHSLIELAGGENIGAQGPSSAFQMNAEEVVAADPEVILLGDFQFGVKPEDVAERPGWGVITAVKNGAIYPIEDPNLTDRPGPRIVQGLELIARLLHPELPE